MLIVVFLVAIFLECPGEANKKARVCKFWGVGGWGFEIGSDIMALLLVGTCWHPSQGFLVLIGRREKTPTPKTRVSIWTLLRTPAALLQDPSLCIFYHKNVCSKAVSVLSKDETGQNSKTGRFLSKAEILGVLGVFSPLSI